MVSDRSLSFQGWQGGDDLLILFYHCTVGLGVGGGLDLRSGTGFRNFYCDFSVISVTFSIVI